MRSPARYVVPTPAPTPDRHLGRREQAELPGRPDWLAPDCEPPSAPLAELIHDQFRALVLHPSFSCLGAKAALRGGGYRMGVYETLGSPDATTGLLRDLSAFVATLGVGGDGRHGDDRHGDRPRDPGQHADGRHTELSTFVASFLGPVAVDEAAFEHLLWAQLQALHDGDPGRAWDPSVSADPEDAHFSFSAAGRAFFVVGLHAASTRWARRFAWPTLVFNPHAQFDRLREQGHFARLQELIRTRERALQGSLNANLSEFGERSEARQYSGRPVGEDWRCPFRAGVDAGVGGQEAARPAERVAPHAPDEDRA